MVEYQEWTPESTLMLRDWAETDPDIGRLMGGTVTDDQLDRQIPERWVAREGDRAVAILGMRRYGPAFGAVHVIAEPTSTLDRGRVLALIASYEHGLRVAWDLGARVLYSIIPGDNKAAKMLVEHVGFRKIPYDQYILTMLERPHGP